MKSLLIVPAALLTAASLHGAVFQYAATLDGASVSPSNGSAGTGSAVLSYDNSTHFLSILLNFSGLTGTTVSGAIHAATIFALTGNATQATTSPNLIGFPTGVTSGTFNTSLNLANLNSYNPSYISLNGGTTAAAETALVNALNSNTAYFNIKTAAFGGGEIRGFISPIPEPGETCLAVGGMIGAFALYRRFRTKSSK